MSSVQNGNHANGISNGAENRTKKVKYDSQGFLRRLFDIMMRDAVEAGCDINNKVVEFVHPKELLTKLDLEIRDSGEPDEAILNLCEDTIHYSVHSGHPHFFNQLWSGLDPYTLGGAWLTEALNTSQYTFEVAPVFILMEDVVLKKLREIVGYKSGDGIFTPGGSMANIYGLSVARYHQFPNVKTEGMYGLPRLIIFTSDHSHYSLKKGAHLLGLGVDNVWMVACDKTGRMIPQELEKRIQEAKSKGFHPFFVNATAGTTVAGAFDPLDAIADVAEKHSMWMHVDAAWGGGALMSSKHRNLLRGIERADSLAWDPHKMMGTVLQCAVFLTKHKNLLQECHSANARYLFQQDKFYDVSYDTGDKSLQCGRKVDVFKLWLMWKARGNIGFERRIDTAFENAKYLAQCIRDRDGFRLVFPEPQCTNVVFWYIPPRMRNLPENDEWWQGLGKIAPQIKERMALKGTMLIGYQPVAGFVNCFRFVTTNGDNVTKKDMDFVLEEIESLGHDL